MGYRNATLARLHQLLTEDSALLRRGRDRLLGCRGTMGVSRRFALVGGPREHSGARREQRTGGEDAGDAGEARRRHPARRADRKDRDHRGDEKPLEQRAREIDGTDAVTMLAREIERDADTVVHGPDQRDYAVQHCAGGEESASDGTHDHCDRPRGLRPRDHQEECADPSRLGKVLVNGGEVDRGRAAAQRCEHRCGNSPQRLHVATRRAPVVAPFLHDDRCH